MTTREINFWNGIALGLVLGVALVLLASCAAEAPLAASVNDLNSPAMQEAIAAAKPGVPR